MTTIAPTSAGPAHTPQPATPRNFPEHISHDRNRRPIPSDSDDKDISMYTDTSESGLAHRGRTPLAPDSPRPPGSRPDPDSDSDSDAVELDESLIARAPVARCADGNGTLTGLFFSDHVVDIARAKAMCALCSIASDCLAAALEREEPWGVWGGQLLSGGRIVADKRPCGRPPKHPRPEVVYDEMGPVGVVA